MPALQRQQLKPREERPNRRQKLIRDIMALAPPHHQGRPLIPPLARILEGKIRQIAALEALRQRVQRDREGAYVGAGRGAGQVREQEVPDRQVLLVGLQDLVGGALRGDARGLDREHAVDVFGEVGLQGGVDGRVVDGDEGGGEGGGLEGEGHGDFGAPGREVGGLVRGCVVLMDHGEGKGKEGGQEDLVG